MASNVYIPKDGIGLLKRNAGGIITQGSNLNSYMRVVDNVEVKIRYLVEAGLLRDSQNL